jgi:hypothetical protein
MPLDFLADMVIQQTNNAFGIWERAEQGAEESSQTLSYPTGAE